MQYYRVFIIKSNLPVRPPTYIHTYFIGSSPLVSGQLCGATLKTSNSRDFPYLFIYFGIIATAAVIIEKSHKSMYMSYVVPRKDNVICAEATWRNFNNFRIL